ncbi:hypothetical protein ACFYPZ_25410 [Streptomyces sp. NPDC005506]|uniref:hypothetical protein n=1 Tax=unclassified Streptomyces TaxID=2593676 RepID=UPI00367C378A
MVALFVALPELHGLRPHRVQRPSRRQEIRLPLHPGERLTYRRVTHREIRQRAALPSERRLCLAPRSTGSAALLPALSATTGSAHPHPADRLRPVEDPVPPAPDARTPGTDRLNAAAAAVPTVPRPDRPDEGEPLASHHPTGAAQWEDTLPAALTRPVI